jgi:hypothetical protein
MYTFLNLNARGGVHEGVCQFKESERRANCIARAQLYQRVLEALKRTDISKPLIFRNYSRD